MEKNLSNPEKASLDKANFDVLHKLFTNVNDWLKFAEAKNLMLITFNAASIYGAEKILESSYLDGHSWIRGAFLVSLVLLVCSAIVCLLSFVPRLNILKGGEFTDKKIKNVWFYETLKGMSNIAVIQEIYQTDKTAFSTCEQDLADQIIQNSGIASRKYAYFTVAVWITITAYVTLIPAAIYFGYDYLSKLPKP